VLGYTNLSDLSIKVCTQSGIAAIIAYGFLLVFKGFFDSWLDFRLWFWMPFEIGLQAQSDVNVEIYNQFAAHNIQIPYPQRDIHIKNMPSADKGGTDPTESEKR